MQISHSRIETFNKCPYKYKLRYIDDVTVIADDKPDNALYLGTALHECIQKSIPEAIEGYFSNYPIISDEIITEAIKLEIMGEKARQTVPEDGIAEVELNTPDFKGFIDWLVPARTEEKLGGEHQIIPYQFDLYDFKYTNNEQNYMDSDQLHLYKYYFEKTHPGQYIRNMYFLFVPKSKLKQGKDEELEQFRKRIIDDCSGLQPYLKQVEYQPEKVIQFLIDVKHCIEADEFKKKQQFLCKWCEYQPYCMEGRDYIMNLPSKERRKIDTIDKKVLWIYGSPFCGKTTFANQFPDPLMLNTDGNIKFVDAPYIAIKDEVTVTGRMTNRKFAWEVFKDVIAELEKKQNDFKTIIVDLLEDTYEHCRRYICDQKGWDHESDDSFRSWDMIRTEFLSTLKRLMNLDYENIILISHEDTSRDFTKKTGDKVSAIKPNMNDKVSNKVAGMVDIVARVVAEDNVRTLSFKSSEVIFGGGRLTVNAREIPLDYDMFLEVYGGKKVEEPIGTPITEDVPQAPSVPVVQAPVEADAPMMGEDEAPKTRSRRSTRTEEVESVTGEVEEPVPEEQPTVRTRRRRSAN